VAVVFHRVRIVGTRKPALARHCSCVPIYIYIIIEEEEEEESKTKKIRVKFLIQGVGIFGRGIFKNRTQSVHPLLQIISLHIRHLLCSTKQNTKGLQVGFP